MRILMLGNSLTTQNDLPSLLAKMAKSEVLALAEDDAHLKDFLDAKSKLGRKFSRTLKKGPWDYVVLQEYSIGPLTEKEAFFDSVSLLTSRIRAANAEPVIFATWAYKKKSKALKALDLPYDIMAARLYDAFHEAAEENEILIADVGDAFQELGAKNPYTRDGIHPNLQGSRTAAKTIASLLVNDYHRKQLVEKYTPVLTDTEPNQGIRVLRLYQTLKKYSDADHPLNTYEIKDIMLREYNIYMHRTTVTTDAEMLMAGGVPIRMIREQKKAYFLEEEHFELPELKILIDAVQSSRFITEKKSRALANKLLTLTNVQSADALKRNIHIPGSIKSGNEKAYYITDAINDAINQGKQISFKYTDYNDEKKQILRNDGNPYIVSPYALIWNGDFYYMVGWYHTKERITVFRVDRILRKPAILPDDAQPAPRDFDISRYTKEVFRMYDTEETTAVTLLCDSEVIKGVLDMFGMDIEVQKAGRNRFTTTVQVCASPTFFGWVFQWGGKVKITGPEEVVEQYREMGKTAAGK